MPSQPISFDPWDIVGLVFFGSIIAGIALYALIRRVNRTNPFHNIHARRRMASEWKRPSYLPDSWQ